MKELDGNNLDWIGRIGPLLLIQLLPSSKSRFENWIMEEKWTVCQSVPNSVANLTKLYLRFETELFL